MQFGIPQLWNEYLELLKAIYGQRGESSASDYYFHQPHFELPKYKLKQQLVKRKDMKVCNFTELQSW